MTASPGRKFLCSILLLGLVSGCGSTEPQADDPGASGESKSAARPDDAAQAVTLALNWHPEAEHGGYYAALVHGYYKEEGLDVTIRPGGPGVRVIADVASGAVAFGVDNADKLMVWRAQQADAVAVLAPLQHSPRCIMVHKSTGLKDLAGLTARSPFTLAINSDQPFARYLQKKLDLSAIQVVKYPGNVVAFLENPEYGQQAYSFSEPFLAREKGADPECLMLSDVGFDTYTSLLIVRRELLDSQAELVAKMTRASLRGWQKYLEDPEQTNQYIHEQNPEMALDVLAFGVEALRPLCLPEGMAAGKFGTMTRERWETLESQLVEIESIPSGSVPAAQAFSTRFVGTQE